LNESKPYILIVDDERGLRLGTKRLLEGEGFNVDAAENGTEGINLGTANDYDLAIIDMKMPDIDGLEVLKEIKKVRPNTVCFIATAFASYDTAIEATRIGAYSYIPKPFTPEELLHQLEKGYNQRVLTLEAEKLRREREERLLELASEQSRLKTIINSISGGVLVVNKTGEVVYFNNAALKNLNLDNLTIGQYILDIIPPEASELVNKLIHEPTLTKKTYSTQLELIKNSLFIEVICSAVLNNDNSFAGVVLVIRNITEMKKIELVKSQFVSMVAHELKTPVAAVQGFLKIILDDSIPVSEEQQKEYQSRSVVRLQGLLDLVNDLLDISRMELKTKHRELNNISLKEILESTVQFLKFETEFKNIKVTLDIPEEIPMLHADSNEITRLFTNIISNAIKYNVINGKININVKADHNYIITEVADTGIGLKVHEKEKLFQEFFRAKNDKTRGIAGTGLGLTIVHRIVESYHGKIVVESEYGKGTTFKIYLPKTNK